MIEESGFEDPSCWIPTDKNKLNIKGYDDAFAIGDATDLPVSKTGSVARYQAKFLSQKLIEELEGGVHAEDGYNG